MQTHYDLLGIDAGASPKEIKAAYHAKLKEFPAHSHPQAFKEIRAAYEALRKAPHQRNEDFFALKPMAAELDEAVLTELTQNAIAETQVTLKELIVLTF